MLSTRYEKAIQLSDEDKHEKALPLWKEHHATLPAELGTAEHFFVHHYYSNALWATGDYSRAINILAEGTDILDEKEVDLRLSAQAQLCNFLFLRGRYKEADAIRTACWPGLLREQKLVSAYYTAKDKYEEDADAGDELLTATFDRAEEVKDADFLGNFYREYAAHLLAQRRYGELLARSAATRDLLEAAQDPDTITILYTYVNEIEVFRAQRLYLNLRVRLELFLNQARGQAPNEGRLPVLLACYEGMAALLAKHAKEAAKWFEIAIERAGDNQDLKLVTLEQVYQFTGELYYYDEALAFCERAREVALAGDDEYAKLDVTVDLAKLLDSAGRFRQSYEALRPIEDQVIALGDGELSERYYALLTTAGQGMPDARVFEYARKCWWAVGETLPDELAYEFYFGYAQILLSLNRIEEAIGLYERAELIAEAMGWTHSRLYSVIEQAVCASMLNRYEEVLTRLRSIPVPVEIDDLHASYRNLLADCQQELGDTEAAVGNYQQVINLTEGHPQLVRYASTAYSNIGLVYHRQKDYGKAETMYLRGLAIDEKLEDRQQQLVALHNLAVLYTDSERYAEAESRVQSALRLMTDTYRESATPMDRKHISDEWYILTEILAEVLIERGQVQRAFRLLINSEAVFTGLDRKSLDELPLPELAPGEGLLAYTGVRQQRMYVLLLYRNKEGGDLQLRHHRVDLEKQYALAVSPSLHTATERFRKRSLGQDGVRDKTYQSDFPWLIRYIHYLLARPERYLSQHQRQRRAALLKVAAKILLPEQLEIGRISRLVVMPDYVLGLLPFGALPVGKTLEKCLVDHCSVSLFGGFRSPENNDNSAAGVVVFGASQYPAQLANLKMGQTEAKLVRQRFTKSISLLDADTSNVVDLVTEAVEDRPPGCLHFIGHAEGRYPESVIHYPTAPEGIITTTELERLPLNGWWVYLSACSSADGLTYGGWGVDSTAMALLRAGADALVSMLFPVADTVAPILAEGYYSAVGRGLKPAAALAEVQRRCRAGELGVDCQEVGCWAGLVVVTRMRKELDYGLPHYSRQRLWIKSVTAFKLF